MWSSTAAQVVPAGTSPIAGESLSSYSSSSIMSPAPSVRPGQAKHVLGEIAEDHLLRNRRDAHQPGFPPVALDVVLARVAKAAMDLHREVSGLEAGLGGQELGQIRLLTAGQAGIDAP